jgi:DNA-directed RNA polymerase specialized sigma24 family protein
MTPKQYLNQAKHLDTMINCRLREIDYWKDLSVSITSGRYDGMPHSPNRPADAAFVSCIERIDEAQKDVAEKVARLITLREEINSQISLLSNRDEQLVLRFRYVDGCTWEDIAGILNVSVRTVHRIHGSALQNFSVPE